MWGCSPKTSIHKWVRSGCDVKVVCEDVCDDVEVLNVRCGMGCVRRYVRRYVRCLLYLRCNRGDGGIKGIFSLYSPQHQRGSHWFEFSASTYGTRYLARYQTPQPSASIS